MTGRNQSKASTFTDPRDGQVYPLVLIGGLIWFAKDLNYATDKSVPVKNNRLLNTDNNQLYNWHDANALACPAGWRLPTLQEVKCMLILFGGYYDFTDNDNNVVSSDSYAKDNEASPRYAYRSLIMGGSANLDLGTTGWHCPHTDEVNLLDSENTGAWWTATAEPTFGRDRYFFSTMQGNELICINLREPSLGFAVRPVRS